MSRPILDFIATHTKKASPLIVSEFGVSSDPLNIIEVNPKDAIGFAKTIKKALLNDNTVRHQDSLKWIKDNSTTNWMIKLLENFQNAKISDLVANMELEEQLITEDLDMKMVIEKYQKAKKRVFLMDYDGTISDIAAMPDEAKPTTEIRTIIKKLVANKNNTLVLITGRSMKDMDVWFPEKNIIIHAEHGAITRKNGVWDKITDNMSWINEAEEIMKFYHQRTPGSMIEKKTSSISFHYRKSSEIIKELQSFHCRNSLRDLLVGRNCEIINGKKVIEVKLAGRDKGKVVDSYLENDFIFCAGDDETDEHMFKKLKKTNAYTILVGDKITTAKYKIKGPECIRKLLSVMADDTSISNESGNSSLEA